MKETSDILNLIRKANPLDVFLVSFFALPFILDAWVGLLTKIGWGQAQIQPATCVLIVIYFICLIIFGVDVGRQRKKERAKDQILGYLQSKNYKMMSIEKVRERIDSGYTDDFLLTVIQEFPKDLRHAKFESGRPGIARIIVEPVEDEG